MIHALLAAVMASLSLWLFYLLGQLFHILKQAQRTTWDPHSPINSVRAYLATSWLDCAWRFLLCTALFVVWWRDPAWILALLARVLPLDLNDLALKPNLFTALVYGFFSDSVLDFLFSFLRSKVPSAATATASSPPQ